MVAVLARRRDEGKGLAPVLGVSTDHGLYRPYIAPRAFIAHSLPPDLEHQRARGDTVAPDPAELKRPPPAKRMPWRLPTRSQGSLETASSSSQPPTPRDVELGVSAAAVNPATLAFASALDAQPSKGTLAVQRRTSRQKHTPPTAVNILLGDQHPPRARFAARSPGFAGWSLITMILPVLYSLGRGIRTWYTRKVDQERTEACTEATLALKARMRENTELAADLLSVTGERNRLQQLLSEAGERLTTMAQQLQGLSGVDAENSHLHSNIEQLNTQLASLQDERDRLRENWELSRAELEAAQQEVAAHRQLHAADCAILSDGHMAELKAVKGRLERAQAQAEAAVAEVDRLRAAEVALQRDANVSAKAHNALREQFERLKTQIDKWRSNHGDMASELEKEKGKNLNFEGRLQAEVAEWQRKLDRALTDVRDANARTLSLETRHAAYSAQVEELSDQTEKELAAAHRHIAELEQEVSTSAAADHTVAELKAKLAALAIAEHSKSRELMASDEALADERNRTSILELQLADLAKRAAEQNVEQGASRNKLQAMVQSLQAQVGRSDELQLEHFNTKTRQCERLQEELSAAQDELGDLKAQFAAALAPTTSVDGKQELLNKKIEELSDWIHKCKVLEEELMRTRKEIKMATERKHSEANPVQSEASADPAVVGTPDAHPLQEEASAPSVDSEASDDVCDTARETGKEDAPVTELGKNKMRRKKPKGKK